MAQAPEPKPPQEDDPPQPEAPTERTVKVRTRSTFFEGADFSGRLLQPGEEIAIEAGRAIELRAQGFVEMLDKKMEADAAKDDVVSTDMGQPVLTTRSLRRPKE